MGNYVKCSINKHLKLRVSEKIQKLRLGKTHHFLHTISISERGAVTKKSMILWSRILQFDLQDDATTKHIITSPVHKVCNLARRFPNEILTTFFTEVPDRVIPNKERSVMTMVWVNTALLYPLLHSIRHIHANRSVDLTAPTHVKRDRKSILTKAAHGMRTK